MEHLDLEKEIKFWTKHEGRPMTKDDVRTIKSYISIIAKCEVSMRLQNKRINQRHFQDEKELEEYCFSHGLIYSPTKYPM